MTKPSLTSGERRLFPTREAAYYLGIGENTLAKLVEAGDLPRTLVFGKVTYDRRDLDAYIDRVKRSA